ncbi:MAG: hypothetical protein OXJ54_05280 [Gemmatimonadetes bacterium]|nr:hypothetical protein [Candidatus Palauibacter rhopaloidicola]
MALSTVVVTSILWLGLAARTAAAPPEIGVTGLSSNGTEVSITEVAGLSERLVERSVASGRTGRKREEWRQEAPNCKWRSSAERNPGSVGNPRRIAALRCVVRAIVGELSRMPTNTVGTTTRIGVSGDVKCALGELRIGAFVNDASDCSPATNADGSIHVDSVLVRVYQRYREEEKHLEETEEDIERLLKYLMNLRGLNRPFRAAVRSGLVLSDVSADGDTSFGTDAGSEDMSWGAPIPTVLWETKTYKRMSLSGGLGQRDVLAVWSRGETHGTKELIVRSVEGFYYDLFANFHVVYPERQLMDVFIGVGQERVPNAALAESSALKLADNRVGSWSFRGEFGIRYRIYDLARVENEYGRYLPMPIMEVVVGIRRHERFSANGDLEFLQKHYKTPRDRLFWRFSMDLRNALVQTDDEDKTWTFLIVAEQEMAWPHSPIPTFTRFVIVGEKSLFAW